MNEIIVKTQAEFDSILDKLSVKTKISIFGNIDKIDRHIENGIISVYGSGRVDSVFENAIIIIKSDSVILSATNNSVIICQDCTPKIKISGCATVVYTKTTKHDINTFSEIYTPVNGKITLYKSVNPENNTDFYSGTIKYEGEVACPDFDPDINRQCGGGLHLSPLPYMALKYNQGKLLVCEVDINDIVVYPDDITKVRCKKVTVIGEYKP